MGFAGTGTGRWCMARMFFSLHESQRTSFETPKPATSPVNGPNLTAETVSQTFPYTNFLGLDLSEIQPDLPPGKVLFIDDDFEHEDSWDADDEYDYVHIRHALISTKDRKTLFTRVFKYASLAYVEKTLG